MPRSREVYHANTHGAVEILAQEARYWLLGLVRKSMYSPSTCVANTIHLSFSNWSSIDQRSSFSYSYIQIPIGQLRGSR